MSGSNYERRSDDYHRSDRDYRYHDHRRRRDRDSRDSDYYGDYRRKRVPGLVSDPDSQLGDVDRAIERGQRETITRVQSDRYSSARPKKSKRESVSAVEPAVNYYKPIIASVTQPYYARSSFRESYTKKKRSFYNPGMLAFLPGLAGLGLIIAAIVLNSWEVFTNFIDQPGDLPDAFRIDYKGLFHVCTVVVSSQTYTDRGCQTIGSFLQAGSNGSGVSPLEQATRALIIIAAILAFASLIVTFIFGLNVFAKAKAAFIAGGFFAFAGACGTAAMGCYSAILVDDINASIESSNSVAGAGTAFYLGWTGIGCLFIASITAFMAHWARRKK